MITARVLDPEQWRSWRGLRLRALAESPWAFGSTLAGTLAKDGEEFWRIGMTPPLIPFVVDVDRSALGMARIMLPTAAPDSDTDPNPDPAAEPTPDPTAPAEIISVWVAPEARGRGAGQALIDACVDWLAAHRPTTRCRLAVVADNHVARRLYERCGFVVIGPNPDDDAELLMERESGPRDRGPARPT